MNSHASFARPFWIDYPFSLRSFIDLSAPAITLSDSLKASFTSSGKSYEIAWSSSSSKAPSKPSASSVCVKGIPVSYVFTHYFCFASISSLGDDFESTLELKFRIEIRLLVTLSIFRGSSKGTAIGEKLSSGGGCRLIGTDTIYN